MNTMKKITRFMFGSLVAASVMLVQPDTAAADEAAVRKLADQYQQAWAKGDAKKAACQSIREDGGYVEAGENDNLIVQKLEANAAAFGIFGYSFLEENADKLQGAKVEGVGPSFETVADKSYPISRELYVYVKNAHVGVIPGIREFVAEYVSERAMGDEGYMADKGLITLTPDKQQDVAGKAMSLQPMN